MVTFPIHRSRRTLVTAVPVLRHAGWLGFFLILAPVIGPRGYGLFAFALSGIAIVEAMVAETVAHVLRHRAQLDQHHWSTALVTAIVAGTVMLPLLYASSGVIAEAVGEGSVGDIFRSLAVLPLLGALGAVAGAALRREERVNALAAASVAGAVAGGCVGVAMAWSGAGPWSLVAQIVVQRLVECTLCWGALGQAIGIAWSREHFAQLVGMLDCRVISVICRAIANHGPCLLVGLRLGPTAAGLYMLAARLAEMLRDGFLSGTLNPTAREAMQCASRIVLPALLASFLLPIGLPPILDPRWWGAILPAQILLGATLAAVLCAMNADGDSDAANSWRHAIQSIGIVASVALAAPYGLGATAVVNAGWLTVMAIAGLWLMGRKRDAGWRAAFVGAARPFGGAAAVGLLLFVLADPVGLALPPVPALCLLIASGWTLYLLIRGEPVAALPLPAPVHAD